MNRVIHFEIQADGPDRASRFYREILGWKIEKVSGIGSDYWMVMTADEKSKEPVSMGGETSIKSAALLMWY